MNIPDNNPDDDKEKNTVTIYVVHSNGDEEDDDWFPSTDDAISFQPPSNELRKPTVAKKKPISRKFKINRGKPVRKLADLIEALVHEDADKEQKDLIESLNELNDMVGMEKLKEQIVNQLLFFMQDLQEPGMFLHTVLTGPPGSGKTSVVNILAKIYSRIGVLDSDKVVKADRASLIGKWLGSTAIKTKEVLDSARGGVLLLDEVYSLGNKDQGDSFSKECIDTINQYLSEHADELICVIAGYKDKVEECFFSYNPGLDRRFPWRFAIDAYKVEDLHKIMELQLGRTGWTFDHSVTSEYINNSIQVNKNLFKGNGGDTKNLIDKCKICHARRVFTLEPPVKRRRRGRKQGKDEANGHKCLNREDIEAGLKSFRESKQTKELENKYEKIFLSKYLRDSWGDKEVDVESDKLYSKYEEFMAKNNHGRYGEGKLLGMVEFIKKICEFKGISQNVYKTRVMINTDEHFEFLKTFDIVTDEMKVNVNSNKYEKIFLSKYLHDSWADKEVDVESDKLYSKYEEFMDKNNHGRYGDKKVLGMVEFIKKICEFKGISQNVYKTRVLINTNEHFQFLKTFDIVTDEMKVNVNSNKYEKIFIGIFCHGHWNDPSIKIDIGICYSRYEEFMSKNRDKKMLGMIEFSKKLGSFPGININREKNEFKFEMKPLFEFLKKSNIVIDEVKDYKNIYNGMYV